MSKQIDLAVIPGDGIGPEVVAEGLKVLRAALPPEIATIQTHVFSLGAAHYHKSGEVLSEETLEKIRANDAIFLGAIGDPSVPAGVLERGLLLKLRFALDHSVNLRPARSYPGVKGVLQAKNNIDFVVVREGTEGLYCGNGGVLRAGTDQEIATEVSVNTAYGVNRVVRYAFAQAMRRRKKVTLVHKKNVLVNAGSLWSRVVSEVAAEYPQVEVDYCHVDAATIYLLTDPERFDVICTDNLFGDILTDEAGVITGGIGLAASANINVEGTAPSMFEPVHGSAPDIAGQQKADPRAAILSIALLLAHQGFDNESRRVTKAVQADVASGASARTTAEIGSDIAAALKSTAD